MLHLAFSTKGPTPCCFLNDERSHSYPLLGCKDITEVSFVNLSFVEVAQSWDPSFSDVSPIIVAVVIGLLMASLSPVA